MYNLSTGVQYSTVQTACKETSHWHHRARSGIYYLEIPSYLPEVGTHLPNNPVLSNSLIVSGIFHFSPSSPYKPPRVEYYSLSLKRKHVSASVILLTYLELNLIYHHTQKIKVSLPNYLNSFLSDLILQVIWYCWEYRHWHQQYLTWFYWRGRNKNLNWKSLDAASTWDKNQAETSAFHPL